MDWFRHYHGLCTDPKLHKIARQAKVSRGMVIAAWCAVLETASQSTPRGDCQDIDDDSLSFMIDAKPSVAGRILQSIKNAGMIDENGFVAAWKKRQRESDDVSTRVQRHRAKKDKSLENNETDHGCNVTVTPLEQNRTEQIRIPPKSPQGEAAQPPPEKQSFPSKTAMNKAKGRKPYPGEFESFWKTAFKRDEDKASKLDLYGHWLDGVAAGHEPDFIEDQAAKWAKYLATIDKPFGLRRWLSKAMYVEDPPQKTQGFGGIGNGQSAPWQSLSAGAYA